MRSPSPSTRDLARRLLEASQAASGAAAAPPEQVIDGLRTSLSRFAGSEGFASLLRRALTLATAEVPALASVRIEADGRLQGLSQLDDEPGTSAKNEAVVTVAAHLLDLLITFIGESITLRLVREAWPDAALTPNRSNTTENQ